MTTRATSEPPSALPLRHACGHRTRHTQTIGCCAGCGLLFSSDSAFARHRRGGECLDPATLERKGELVFRPRPSRTAPGETLWSLAGSGMMVPMRGLT